MLNMLLPLEEVVEENYEPELSDCRLSRGQAFKSVDMIRSIAHDHFAPCFGSDVICDDFEQLDTVQCPQRIFAFERWCKVHHEELWHIEHATALFEGIPIDNLFWMIYKNSPDCRYWASCGLQCIGKGH